MIHFKSEEAAPGQGGGRQQWGSDPVQPGQEQPFTQKDYLHPTNPDLHHPAVYWVCRLADDSVNIGLHYTSTTQGHHEGPVSGFQLNLVLQGWCLRWISWEMRLFLVGTQVGITSPSKDQAFLSTESGIIATALRLFSMWTLILDVVTKWVSWLAGDPPSSHAFVLLCKVCQQETLLFCPVWMCPSLFSILSFFFFFGHSPKSNCFLKGGQQLQ